MRNTFLVIAGAVICLIAVLFGVAHMWRGAGLHLSMHGWIAYGLGGVASFVLAGGLFFLTFKSAREGYDDLQRPEEFDE
ncbi:MAG: hypothetical protein L3J02_03680 [Henriciella sp.]|nr:hypothetical protein [Henriciella sp.]